MSILIFSRRVPTFLDGAGSTSRGDLERTCFGQLVAFGPIRATAVGGRDASGAARQRQRRPPTRRRSRHHTPRRRRSARRARPAAEARRRGARPAAEGRRERATSGRRSSPGATPPPIRITPRRETALSRDAAQFQMDRRRGEAATRDRRRPRCRLPLADCPATAAPSPAEAEVERTPRWSPVVQTASDEPMYNLCPRFETWSSTFARCASRSDARASGALYADAQERGHPVRARRRRRQQHPEGVARHAGAFQTADAAPTFASCRRDTSFSRRRRSERWFLSTPRLQSACVPRPARRHQWFVSTLPTATEGVVAVATAADEMESSVQSMRLRPPRRLGRARDAVGAAGSAAPGPASILAHYARQTLVPVMTPRALESPSVRIS